MLSRREARKFTTPESFHLFMEGLRSLQDYDCESAKVQPDSEALKKTLLHAQEALESCVLKYPDDILPHYYLGMVFTVHAQVEQALYFKGLLKVEAPLESTEEAKKESFTETDLLRLPDNAASYLWKAAEHFSETGKRAGLGDVQRYACYNQAQALARLNPDTPDPSSPKDSKDNWIRAHEILSGLQIPGFKQELLGKTGFRAHYSWKELLGSNGFRAYGSVLKYWWNRIYGRKTAREDEALALQTSMVLNFIELRREAWDKRLTLAEIPLDMHPASFPQEVPDSPGNCLKCLLQQINNARGEKIRKDMTADYWNKWAFVVWERALLEDKAADREPWLEAVERYLKFLESDRSWWTPWQLNQVRLLEARYQMLEALPDGIPVSKPLTFRTGPPAEEAPAPPPAQPEKTVPATSLTPSARTELQKEYKKTAEEMLARILGAETPSPALQPAAPAVDVDKIAAVVAVWAAERDAIATASNMRRSFPGLSADTLGKVSVALAGKVPAALMDQICRQYTCQS